MTDMDDLFTNSRDALTFAFNFASGQYPESPISKMVGGQVGRGKGLVAEAGAGQSGMILAALKQMEPMRANCIRARYAPKFTDCPCCGGKKPLDTWRNAISELAEWSASTFSGLSHRIVREAIILNYFDRGISMDEAAKSANVPTKTVYNQRAKIHAALALLDQAAQSDIEDILEAKQILAALHD